MFQNLGADDLVRPLRPLVLVNITFSDVQHVEHRLTNNLKYYIVTTFLSFLAHLSEESVLLRQTLDSLVSESDKELTTVGIGTIVRHSEETTTVERQPLVKFILNVRTVYKRENCYPP